MTAVKEKFLKVIGYSLINIRLCFYCLALLNLLVTAFVTLSIDVTVEEDPKVRAYSTTRWLLLTCWFNMVSVFYIFLCLYCDWREKHRDDTLQIEHLRRIRDIIMTSILFPVTAYSDFIFWIFYKSYPWVISPLRVLYLVPVWAQHSLHTVSFVFVFLDLVLTPRKRPKSHKKHLAVLYGFSCFYSFVMYVSFTLGISVYAFLETASRSICILTFITSLLIVTVSYYCQWFLVDYVWSHKSVKLYIKHKGKLK